MKQLKPIFILLCVCLFSGAAWGQHTVTGKVIDETDLELIGVTIYVKEDPSSGTITDIDGTYSISLQNSEATLVFSYTGYETQEIPVGARKVIDLKMNNDIANLDEIVVTGYGVQKKALVTGAIAKVNGEDLKNLPVQRIEQSLQGRTSGVRVTTSSGQPGAGATVRVRGTTTIGDSNPLYVVDGVPIEGGIDFLNQNDIESIEVLKDAASAGIYGARSANGVILVTTKTGKSNSLAVNYNGYYGIQNPWRKLRLLNATEYATIRNESRAAAGLPIEFADPQSLGEGTDWQDAVFNEDAPIQSHDFSVSAGSENSTFFLSFGLFDQEGIVAPDDSQYRRYTVRMNSRHEVGKKFVVGNTLSYTRINASGVTVNSEFGSPLGRAINIDPITPLYETDPDALNSAPYLGRPVVRDSTGVFGISELVTQEIVNPVADLAVREGFGFSDKVVGTVYGELELIEGLKYRSNFGFDLANFGGENFTPIFFLNSSTENVATIFSRTKARGAAWNWDNTVSYTKSFNGHKLTGLVGTTAFQNSGNSDTGTLRNTPANDLESASAAFFVENPADQTYNGFEYEDKLISYFGRFNYNYQEKYLLALVYRVDGSSKFLATNRFATFPSVSAGWVISEESFFRNNPYVNFLKFRGSWGINGNNRIDNNAFLATVSGGQSYPFGIDDDLVDGVTTDRAANPNLKWEETHQTNFGFDAKIFKKFAVTLDLFIKKTEDMLLEDPFPDFAGSRGPIANVGTLENKGVELELGYGNTFGEVSVDVSGNITYVENEVTFLSNGLDFLPGQRFGPQGLEITRITPGLPIGYLFGFETDGLFQNQAEVDAYVNEEGEPLLPDAAPGDIRFVDRNGDGVVDDDDRGIIGDPTPTWTYGVTLNVNYKGFDLLMFGQGVFGNDIFNATRRFDLPTSNYPGFALSRWTGEGTSNDFPRVVDGDPNTNFSRSSDFYVENGAFFRIKTLQLGYTIPNDVLQKVGLNRARVYVSGNNLLTFTQYEGFDPEIGAGGGVDRGLYPQARFFLVGLSAGF